MQEIVANVSNVKFDIEWALENQLGAQALPFPGMDSEYLLCLVGDIRGLLAIYSAFCPLLKLTQYDACPSAVPLTIHTHTYNTIPVKLNTVVRKLLKTACTSTCN